MRVFDCNRIIGAVPTGFGAVDPTAAIAELDRLAIDGAAVTPAWQMYGDPRTSAAYVEARGAWEDDARLIEVPVLLLAGGEAGWPARIDDLGGAPVVRVCPVRHRWDVTSPAARVWWRALADRGVVIGVDVGEVGLTGVAQLASIGLRVLMLAPGYREFVRVEELLQAHGEVYVETGTLITAGAIEALARSVGAHRMLFGTGAPLWDDAGPRFQLDHLDLPDEDVALIAAGSWELLTGGVS